MSAAFTPPTAAEILARMAIDPQFAAVVAEFAAAHLAWVTGIGTPDVAERGRLWSATADAVYPLVDSVPGAREAYDAAHEQLCARQSAERAEEVA